MLGCVATATSCTAAKACLSYEDLDDNDPRCSFQPDAEVCEGTDQVVCDGDAIFHCTNAAYVGSECLDIPGDAGGVECVKDDSCPAFPSCSSPTVDDYCTDIGGHAQFDCSIYGDYCETFTDDGGPNADCFQGPGEEQNEDCGDDKVSCDAKGRVSICAGDVGIVYDCNALGETCVTGPHQRVVRASGFGVQSVEHRHQRVHGRHALGLRRRREEHGRLLAARRHLRLARRRAELVLRADHGRRQDRRGLTARRSQVR